MFWRLELYTIDEVAHHDLSDVCNSNSNVVVISDRDRQQTDRQTDRNPRTIRYNNDYVLPIFCSFVLPCCPRTLRSEEQKSFFCL